MLFAVTLANWAQLALALSVLVFRGRFRPTDLALGILLIVIGFANGGPIVEALAPQFAGTFYLLTVPAYALLAPGLYFFASGLMAETPLQLQRRDLIYFGPAALGLMLVVLDSLVPDFTPPASAAWTKTAYVGTTTVLWLSVIGATGVQFFVFGRRLYHQLPRYRDRLDALFSDHQARNATALRTALFAGAAVWLGLFCLAVLGNITGSAPLGRIGNACIFLGLGWVLSVWGLLQQATIVERTRADPLLDHPGDTTDRISISVEAAANLADQLDAAMREDRLYLDPLLSLRKLARHVAAPPATVSTVLNEHLESSFFDFVNRWRVEAAKPLILAGEKTVLDVALDVGFNARSSFYRSFQRFTGMTPTEFRARAGGAGERATADAG